MDVCVFCNQPLTGEKSTVTLTAKGCDGISRASIERECDINTELGQLVHVECRRVYCNPNNIQASRKRSFDSSASGSDTYCLRSKISFSMKEHCLFCGKTDNYDHRRKDKGHKLIHVSSTAFHTEIGIACQTRTDKWSEIVQGRLNSVNDLFAADAVYHHICSRNFRTNKCVPHAFQDDEDPPDIKRGRPQDTTQTEAFLKVAQYLEDNDEEQITINDLIEKMGEFLCDTDSEAYGFTHMKDKLLSHFCDKIIITEINGKCNVVTFRSTASSILHDFYFQGKNENPSAEKLRIIETAAKLIKCDIQSVNYSKESYPSCHDISSCADAMAFLPESTKLLLQVLFPSRTSDVKVASLGQAVIQATRPRVILAPLQIGLGVQLHHHFASKFLIDSLNRHGFCSSYSEVQKFIRSAAVIRGTDIPSFTPGHFIQYVADNVDHNIRTLDGRNTFHGMGMIATVTPGTKNDHHIPRISVTAEDIAAIGTVNIEHFVPLTKGMHLLQYEQLNNSNEKDPTANADALWKVSLAVGPPRPGWSGMMQMAHRGEHPGKSSVLFLPMIDLEPGNMSCIYSTLQFICNHAHTYQVTPIITFDQPLWWKATQVIESEPDNSDMHNIVLRLGGFHSQMSYLGCIGHIMAGSGLQEMLETIYANNTVTHMLTGKAVERAIRGFSLVDAALNALLISKVFHIQLPCMTQYQSTCQTDSSDEDNVVGQIERHMPANESGDDSNAKDILENASTFYETLLDGRATLDDVCRSDELITIIQKLETGKLSLQNSRTANIWLQFMQMMDILRKFLKSERTGNWLLNLQALHEMLPYLAAAGHNLYTKSLCVYLQNMASLEDKHPDVFHHFTQGLHVVRRSDRFWAGLSPDLVIEQVLMRSMKTSGGLTRGRGMTETQRLVWLMAHPICSEVNDAMQELTDLKYSVSEQHKEETKSRLGKDTHDMLEMLEFLDSRHPFEGDLRNIATGVNAASIVNADHANEIGLKILESMAGNKVLDYTFRKKNQIVTMGHQSAIKIDNEDIQIDSQLLFQRLVTAGTRKEQLAELFQYELCSFPSALFESKYVMRPANKPVLADAIWSLMPTDIQGPTGDIQYVLDGGALLQRIPWTRGTTYEDICKQYTNYVSRKYGRPTIVFDGYSEEPSTKDSTHSRRSGGHVGAKVNFTSNMVMKCKKEDFLSNKDNKQRFITMLGDQLQENGCSVRHAHDDADVLITQTVIDTAKTCTTVLVADDTDLIVLLCHHASDDDCDIFVVPEAKSGVKKSPRCWNIKLTRSILGTEVCKNLLFAHAILGCDTTSRIYGIGKGLSLKCVRNDAYFCAQAQVFLDKDATSEDIVTAGENVMVCIYKGDTGEEINSLRLKRFQQKVASSLTSVESKVLPPTASSTKYHSLRVYYQVQVWTGHEMPSPLKHGWKEVKNKLIPIQTDIEVAPKSLLEVIRCKCKTGCATMRCSCRKAGLDCSCGCLECKGICDNMAPTESVEDSDQT